MPRNNVTTLKIHKLHFGWGTITPDLAHRQQMALWEKNRKTEINGC